MILMREECTSSRSRDRHGLFFMNKQRMCVWAQGLASMEFQRFSILVAWEQSLISRSLETSDY